MEIEIRGFTSYLDFLYFGHGIIKKLMGIQNEEFLSAFYYLFFNEYQERIYLLIGSSNIQPQFQRYIIQHT